MKFNINFNDYSKENNWYLYCFKKFNNIPNTLILHSSFVGDKFLSILKSTQINTVIEVIDNDENIYNQKSLHKIEDDIYVSFLELDKNTEDYFITEVTFYYTNNKISVINNLINDLEVIIDEDIEREEISNKFHTISLSAEGLSIIPFSLSKSDVDIDNKYNPSTIKSISKLKNKLKKVGKGLTVFYGEKGTGKTEMLKFLLDTDKMFIFIPLNSIDLTINNPEFRNLLQIYPNSVLVIDDCESFSNSHFQKNNYTMCNILQLVDGPLSDSLNLNILMIFNETDFDEIDEDIINSNNLLDIVYFDRLDVNLSNDLSKLIGNNKKYKSNQRLVDVFRNKKEKSKNKMGL